MLKILGLLSALLIVIATMGVGTWAYFNDVETATGNTIIAGKLNLKVGGTDGTVTPFDLTATKQKPGRSGTAATWALENMGDLDGTLAITISPITNNENTRYHMEEKAGDNTDGAATGELGSLLKLAFWHDINGDGNLDTGEKYLDASDGSVDAWSGADDTPFNITNVAAAYATVDSYGGNSFASVATINGGATAGEFQVEYNFPDAGNNSDNKAQSDSVVFDITWTLQ